MPSTQSEPPTPGAAPGLAVPETFQQFDRGLILKSLINGDGIINIDQILCLQKSMDILSVWFNNQKPNILMSDIS